MFTVVIAEKEHIDSISEYDILVANDDTVWWKRKSHSLKHKGSFAMLTKATFFQEYVNEDDSPIGQLTKEALDEAIDQATVEYYRNDIAENSIYAAGYWPFRRKRQKTFLRSMLW